MSSWDEKTNISAEPNAAATQPVRRDRAYLIVLAGTAVGEMHKIDEARDNVIGRGQRARVRVLDDGISREHARVVVEGDKVFLEDMNSTNGTFCNGTKVDGRRELADGDKILIGSTTILKFTYNDNLDESFQRQMYESALRDGLTRAFNKKYLLDRLDSEFAYALRHHTPLTLIMLDVDNFKQINDGHGHPGGDYVLSELAAGLMGSLRAEDVFARYGGEEFAVVCRGVDRVVGRVVGERLRKLVEKRAFVFEGKTIPVTISVGVASLPETTARSAGELVAAADEALYESKRGGRNRVAVR